MATDRRHRSVRFHHLEAPVEEATEVQLTVPSTASRPGAVAPTAPTVPAAPVGAARA